jgi:hypothetical protein
MIFNELKNFQTMFGGGGAIVDILSRKGLTIAQFHSGRGRRLKRYNVIVITLRFVIVS